MPADDDGFLQLASMINGLEQAVRQHRDVVFRAISQLNLEVIGFTQRLDKDDDDRKVRQQQLDGRLDRIEFWQRVRIGVEVVLLLTLLAYYLGGR